MAYRNSHLGCAASNMSQVPRLGGQRATPAVWICMHAWNSAASEGRRTVDELHKGYLCPMHDPGYLLVP